MVGFASSIRNVAAGEGASPIPQRQRTTDPGRDQPVCASNIHDLGVGSQHNRHDLRIAQEPPQVARADLRSIDQQTSLLGLVAQLPVVHHH
jgi:hypothetical protein